MVGFVILAPPQLLQGLYIYIYLAPTALGTFGMAQVFREELLLQGEDHEHYKHAVAMKYCQAHATIHLMASIRVGKCGNIPISTSNEKHKKCNMM